MARLNGTRGRIADLKRYRTDTKYSNIKTRIDIIIKSKHKFGPRRISRELGIAASIVTKWINRYKAAGLEGLMDRERPGQPKRLPLEKEGEFRNRVLNGPLEEDGVSRFTAEFLKVILYDEFYVSYTTSGIYRLLKRLGIKKKATTCS